MVKTLHSCPFFEQNNPAPPWLFDNWKFLEDLHKDTSQECKNLLGPNFSVFVFFGYLVRKVPNIRNIAILTGVCAINSAKMKNSKIRSGQVFWTIERYLCANFQVKRSNGEGGVAIWRSFFSKSWSKHCIFSRFLVHFLLRRPTFKCP